MKHHSEFHKIKAATFTQSRRDKNPAASTGNADPQMARRAFRERDALAVEGSAAEERMDRPGRYRAKGGRVVVTPVAGPVAGFGRIRRGAPSANEGHPVDRHGGREYARGGRV